MYGRRHQQKVVKDANGSVVGFRLEYLRVFVGCIEHYVVQQV
jgi:hypothetical protein